MYTQIVTLNGRRYEYKGYVINPKIGTPGEIAVGTFHLFASLEGYSPILKPEHKIEGINIVPFLNAGN